MSAVKWVAAFAVMANLSACVTSIVDEAGQDTGDTVGAEEGDGSDETTGNDSGSRYEEITSEIRPIRDALNETDPIDSADFPDMGTTTYTGYMDANLHPGSGTGDDAALGVMTVTAGWEDNSITGSVTDIIDGSDRAYVGSLEISNGVIGDRISAQITGTLENAASETLVIDGTMSGDFFDDFTYAEGSFDGSVTSPSDTTEFAGGWIASSE